MKYLFKRNGIMEITKSIKPYREKHNLTQAQMAEKLNVSVATLAGWENGLVEPQEENMKALMEVLKNGSQEKAGSVTRKKRRSRFNGEKVTLYTVGEHTVAIDSERKAFVI